MLISYILIEIAFVNSAVIGLSNGEFFSIRECNAVFLLYFQMKQVKDYTIIRKIGKGGFAKVYTATRGKESELYALKKIEKNDEHTEKYIEGELEIAKQKLKHRNIIQILEYFRDGSIYIVMEYCEMGDLSSYLVKAKPDINQRIVFMTHMALGVNYLHNQNIIHRDIKPENVLITNKTGEIVCKITDFGVSRIKLSKNDMFQTYVGSFPYMAPEITGDQEYGNEVDIFALGMLFYAVYKYTILTTSFGTQSLIPGLYVSGNRIAYLNEVMKREKPTLYQFIEKYFQDSNIVVGKFIFSMIELQPGNRPQMDFVLIHISEIKVQHELYPTIERQEEAIKYLQNQNKELRIDLHENEMRNAKSMKDLQNQNEELRNENTEKERIANLWREQTGHTVANLQKQIEGLLEERSSENRKQNEVEIQSKETLNSVKVLGAEAETPGYAAVLHENPVSGETPAPSGSKPSHKQVHCKDLILQF